MERLPWERQKGESRQAFEAFCVYRDMGPARSHSKVAKELGKSITIISRWSSRWNWVARTMEWDQELDRRNIEAQIEAKKEMAERHIKVSMMFQQKIIERLRSLNPDSLSPSDLARWFEVAVRIEQLNRGEPTERTEQTIDARVKSQVDYSNLTDGELAQLEALIRKLDDSSTV